jgi:hypothetical protein
MPGAVPLERIGDGVGGSLFVFRMSLERIHDY